MNAGLYRWGLPHGRELGGVWGLKHEQMDLWGEEGRACAKALRKEEAKELQ